MVTGQAASGAWCGMAGRSSRRQGKASSKQQRWRGGVIGSGDARGGQAKKQAATPGQGGGGAVGSGGSGAQQFFLFFNGYITASCRSGSDGAFHHHQVKSIVPKTGGDRAGVLE